MENFYDALEQKKPNDPAQRKLSKTASKEEPILQKAKPYTLIDNEWCTSIESNQLASNHPIEDRLRIATLNLNTLFSKEAQVGTDRRRDAILGFGVFDGHGGGMCADIITRRLFNYITITLRLIELKLAGFKFPTGRAVLSKELINKLATDHIKSPSNKFYFNVYKMYETSVAERLQHRIEEFEFHFLEQFLNDEIVRLNKIDEVALKATSEKDLISEGLKRAFDRCDHDLSEEIEQVLLTTSSNILLHYYLSLAVSGCCATVLILHNDRAIVASTGDCRAVMGTLRKEVNQLTSTGAPIVRKVLKPLDLSNEHNSDNVNELNRLMAAHPKEEHNYIIRHNRLLGQLMPLRAFGDFSFKWTADKMRKLGLTKAFGSHIIPTHYKTPPYLVAEPEIEWLDLRQQLAELEKPEEGEENSGQVIDRFIVLATDGLWEQFESARTVIKTVSRHRQNTQREADAYCSTKKFIEADSSESHPLTLSSILERIKQRVLEPQMATFERVTGDDDLIEDINCATFLMRTALSDIFAGPQTNQQHKSREVLEEEKKFSHHIDQYVIQKTRHAKLVSYLTLPQSVVRNFRDDISLIVIGLK